MYTANRSQCPSSINVSHNIDNHILFSISAVIHFF